MLTVATHAPHPTRQGSVAQDVHPSTPLIALALAALVLAPVALGQANTARHAAMRFASGDMQEKGGAHVHAHSHSSVSTYYVSASGNDSYDGRNAETPKRHFAALPSLNPGDRVLLKRGDVFRETLHAASGVTYDAYGAGAKPLIIGTDPVTGWSAVSGSMYEATLTTKPGAIYIDPTDGADNMPLVPQSSRTEVEANPGSWWHDGTRTLYVHLLDGSDPSGHTIEASTRIGISGDSKAGVALRNVSVERCREACIYSEYDADDWLVEEVTVRNGEKYGIYITATVGGGGNTIRNSVVGRVEGGEPYSSGIILRRGRSNLIAHNSVQTGINAIGIQLDNAWHPKTDRAAHGIIEHNTVAGSGSGIQVHGTTNAVTRHNTIRDGWGFGIGTGWSNNHLVYRNLVHDLDIQPAFNNYNGLDTNEGSTVRYINNTVRDVHSNSWTIEGGSSGEVRNNIFDQRGAARKTNHTNAYVTTNAVNAGVDASHNLYMLNPASNWVGAWDGFNYYTPDRWRARSGETNSLYNPAGPVFSASAGDAFTLDAANSPAVDAGLVITGVNETHNGEAPDLGYAESQEENPMPTEHSEQRLNLTSGWNMISTHIAPADATLDNIFSEVMTEVIIVKDQDGQTYIPEYDIDTIDRWNLLKAYMVYVESSVYLSVRGHIVNPEAQPVPLQKGWNYVPYLPGSSMTVQEALASIARDLVIVKNIAGAVYMPKEGIGTLEMLRPGQGYKVYVSQPCTLTYPAATSNAAQ